MKVSIIGAGQVGSTLAMRIAEDGIADVVLVDIVKNLAQGKALDILDAAPIVGHERDIIGTDDYRYIRSSDIVVITAGLPRKPGMTREELIAKNASIVKDVATNVREYAPSAVVIVVTNPLDVMTYLAYKVTGFKRGKVFGMAGVLDGARLAQMVASELKVERSSVQTYILGSHGDTMVPILSKTFVKGKPIRKLLPKEKIDAIVARTRDRGQEIVSLLGSGSAYYSPSAAVVKMIKSVISDKAQALVASAYLSGEYGLRDICIGVPCEISKDGIRRVIELELEEDEKEAFLKSAGAIKKSIELLRI